MMLSIGSVLKSAYGAAGVPALRNGARAAPAAWGEGIADTSLTELWYPCDWTTVDEDELVFLIPSLVGAQGRVRATDRHPLSLMLRRAAARHLASASRGLGLSGREAIAMMARLEKAGVPQCRHQEELDRALAAPCGDDYSGSGIARGREPAIHLAVAACLDGVLRDAGAAAEPDPRTLLDRLSDILVATIHSGLNAAYVYSSLAGLHEMFATGAWLGHLSRGRPALMPAAVAEYLASIGPERRSGRTGPVCNATDLLLHPGIVGDPHRLLVAARKVQSSGRARLVAPPRPRAAGRGGHPVWNSQLFERMQGLVRDLRHPEEVS